MPKFNLDNYELVEDRLKKFWKDHPNGRINTDVISSSDDGTMVIVKAELFINKDEDTPVSSGLAQETKGQGGFANTDSWMENAETSAIGRALANWKYQGSDKPRPSREEMSKVGTGETNKNLDASSKATLEKAKEEFAEVIKDDDMKYRLQEALKFHESDKTKRDKYKRECWDEFTKTNPSNLDEWNDDTFNSFLDMFVEIQTAEKGLIEEVFTDGVVESDEKKCPSCDKFGYIEDNREKKATDPGKFGKIPDFACSNYGEMAGCGKGWWINSEDLPTQWL
tara:strand:- start:373 stop:1215 length:843 start_codon:yes stop_codon:yes gene_type:complete